MSKLVNSYDLIAEQWHATASERGQDYVARVLKYIDRVLEGLPAGAHMLDLGCGTGEPFGRYIVNRGYRLTGIDQSAEMLRFARLNLPAAQLIHADMVEFEFNQIFDAAVVWDSMFHVERKHHATIYQKLADALKLGSKCLLSIGGSAPDETDDSLEGFTSKMFGQTFYYSGFAPNVARNLIEHAGFEIELWEVDDPSSRGHIAVIARRTN